MAKRTMSWDLNKATGELTCTHLDNGDKKQVFGLAEIFPDWADLTEVQANIIANGVAQKLGDSCARSVAEKLTPNERWAVLSNVWDRLLEGTWTMKSGDRMTPQKRLDKQIEDGEIEVTPELEELAAKLGLKINK